MKIKAYIALCCLSVFGAAIGYARPDREMVDEHLGAALERLQLREDQKEPVQEILSDIREDRTAILRKYGFDPENEQKPSRRDRRKMAIELKQARAEQERRLSAVLDEEQMETFRSIRQELAEQAKAVVKERRAEKGLED